jgi:hypothetical protein
LKRAISRSAGDGDRPVWRRLAAAGRAVAVAGGLGLVFIVMTALRVIHGE